MLARELPIFKMLLWTHPAQVTKEVAQVGADRGDQRLIGMISLDVIHAPRNPSSHHSAYAYRCNKFRYPPGVHKIRIV